MDSFNSKSKIKVGKKEYTFWRLQALEEKGLARLQTLPYSIRVLLENLLRNEDGQNVRAEDIKALAGWEPKQKPEREIAFRPARVILQDFTGVPAVVDLAAMRDAMVKMGGDPKKINPLQPVDLVIDHSVQVDVYGSPEALSENETAEFKRNRERYEFLRWGSKAFRNFRVVPPGMGIIHQVNLEYLASVVFTQEEKGGALAYPDTVVGTDSHTTMINGLGVLGWGVGGIEAEAAMLGQPISMLIPEVIGFRLTGRLKEGVTAADLVLTATQMLRAKGVVGKFVEFFGPGLGELALADRATLANMAPEYGATMGFVPVDQETLNFLKLTGRSPETIQLVEAYLKEQGLFRLADSPDPDYSDVLELDLAKVEASLAGPKRPQDRITLKEAASSFKAFLKQSGVDVQSPKKSELDHGSVVIAAITSCTHTSNPSVMMAAGLVAKKAVEKGLQVKPWVKTSLSPGSRVVIDYLEAAGLLPYLEKLHFHNVGFGCMTCIGNSGPLPEEVTAAIQKNKLIVASVLSGNRNFEGRIHPFVRANYLASPGLVVAYALAGRMDIDWGKESLGKDKEGKEIFLRDLWPSSGEIQKSLSSLDASMFQKEYAKVFEGDSKWQGLKTLSGDTFSWDGESTYIKNPPYFQKMKPRAEPVRDIRKARALVVVGDSVTTDHISPAGSIAKDGPAGEYLFSHGVKGEDFNSFGSRRGNHEVMMRGTFANIRLRNLLAPGTEGGWTRCLPGAKPVSIYEAAMKYQKKNVPLVILAGKEYGTGSSRDWAAKGPALLGVKAVIAESFERIHRSNLIGMGILPLQFSEGETRASLGLTGEETYDFLGIEEGLIPGKKIKCSALSPSGGKIFEVICRLDTPVEVLYYGNGGILPFVLRQLLKS